MNTKRIVLIALIVIVVLLLLWGIFFSSSEIEEQPLSTLSNPQKNNAATDRKNEAFNEATGGLKYYDDGAEILQNCEGTPLATQYGGGGSKGMEAIKDLAAKMQEDLSTINRNPNLYMEFLKFTEDDWYYFLEVYSAIATWRFKIRIEQYDSRWRKSEQLKEAKMLINTCFSVFGGEKI